VLSAHKSLATASNDELIASMHQCPNANTARRIVDNLQIHGFAVVDDLFPQEAHEKLSQEVQQAINAEIAEKGNIIAPHLKPQEKMQVRHFRIQEYSCTQQSR
jgi:hypothetical protein